jgi:glyoxylase-like metal-dependent hydrolase (beta-lactamase superfamily II)/rhodanese-related sulfurtransferase
MNFYQVLNEELGCASYLLADEGLAIVVDPRWDVAVYVELADRLGARITDVVDTHDHADHVSGRGRLSRLTGAIARHPGAGLGAGDVLRAGRVTVTAIATPGHRPEHLSLVVRDGTRGTEPWCVLSGDSLLVGDVARPDLAVDPQAGARALHASLRELFILGDHVELWPAHLGGSLCGGGRLSPKTSSTIGFERLSSSPASLGLEDFVSTVSSATPPKPPNLQSVVARNRGTLAEEPVPPAELDAGGVGDALVTGATVLDIRPADAFDAGHLETALNFAPAPGRVTRAGWAAAPDEPLVVIGGGLPEARRFAEALYSIGLWRIVGVAGADPEGWRTAGLPVRTAESWTLASLAEALLGGRVDLVDVRDEAEFATGHVPGSQPLPLHELADGRSAPRFQRDPVAVACAGGARAALAASLLRRAGNEGVVRLAGGGIGDLPPLGVELEGP